MTKIIYQYSKQKYMRLVILFFMLLNIVAFETQAQTLSIISTDDVYGITCVGETRTYKLIDTVSNVNYTWSVSPAGQCNFIYVSNTQVQIQWYVSNTNPGFQIIVNGSDNSTANRNETVLEALNPFIIASSEVGCQESSTEHDSLSNIIVEDSSGCIKVCEDSWVTYYAKDMFPLNDLTYRFEWTITGGVIYVPNQGGLLTPFGTTITNSNFNGNPLDSIKVLWGATGEGNITVTEYCIYECTSKSYTLCIKKIEKPEAKFIFDNLTNLSLDADLPLDSCYQICLNQTLNFQDLSTANSDSAGLFWEWDFGDGSPTAFSVLQNPSHTYSTPGQYTVVLWVTNKCGCKSHFKRRICVLEQESPQIYCTSVECENNTAIYHTDALCEYIWTISGGTKYTTSNDNEVAVKWDNIGADGFGYVSLLGLACNPQCPNSSTVKIPVIQAHASISGPLNVCTNTNYHYTLPAWPATNFTWEIIEYGYTGTISASYLDNSNEIEIKTGNIAGKFWLVCNYVNTLVDCKGTDTILVNIENKPIITAPAESCKNTAVSCYVYYPNGCPGASWKVIKPNGSVVTQNYTTSCSITFSSTTFDVSGTYTIQAFSTGSSCDPDPVTIKVIDPPAIPTAISGEDKVCLHYPYTYTVSNMPNTTASWTIIGGEVSGTTATTAIGNIISVTWNSSGAKSLAVSRSWNNMPGCTSDAYSDTITQIVVSGAIAKTPIPDSTVCGDATYDFNLSLNNNVIGESYEWSVYPVDKGSISLGQSSTSAKITFNHVTATTNCEIRCRVTKCGQTTLIYIPIIIVQTPNYEITVSPNPVCSGSNVTFSLTSSVPGTPTASATYDWNFGDGSTGTLAPSSTSHTYFSYSDSNSTYNITLNIINSGCGEFSHAFVNPVVVMPSPMVNISPGNGQTVCTDSIGNPYPYSILLTSSASSNLISNPYQWLWNLSSITGANASTYTLDASSQAGKYQLQVTGSNNCTTVSNDFILNYIPCGDTLGMPNCIPVPPFGDPVLTQATPICDQAQITSVVAGSPPNTNIWSYNWIAPLEDGYTGFSGTSSINSSYIYNFNKPGVYWIAEEIFYKNSNFPNDQSKACMLKAAKSITIPLVADFIMNLSCNYAGGCYNLNLTDHSAKYYNENWDTWQWFIDNNGNTPNYTGQNVLDIPTTVGTHTVRLKVTLQSGYTCELEQTINIPIQPIPNFTISTTNLVDSNTKSCEGREIKFTNTSNPLSNVAYAVWNFSDNTSLHALHAAKVYVYDQADPAANLRQVSLTVTDKHNCNYTTVHTVTIDKNNLSAKSYPFTYILNPLTSPCYGQSVNVKVDLAAGSSTPNAYQWYNETQPMQLTTVNNINVNNSGAYWVQLKDAKYCYKNINPAPATVSFKYPIPAIITGKQNVCVGNSVTLNAPGGTGLSYSWERDGFTVSTAQSLNENLPAGDYYYVLTLSQDGGCTSVSPPYHVTVHDLPPPPAIALSVVDCANYTLELSASGSGSNYTWSNGKSGSPIQINSGGAYRVWLTDDYGCRNHADIDVPFSPATYFWRFPTGCYSYCPGELPKRVDGPAHIDFYKWTWLIDGSIVPYNGNYQGVGHNECDPLILSLPTIGSGSGDYSWMLYNGLCEQQSGIMNVEMKEECCDVVIKNVLIECKDDHYVLKLFVDNETPGCDSAFFNLYVLDSATNSPYILDTLIIPNMLIYGSNTITASLPFDSTMFNTAIVIKIETFCNSWEHCIGIFDTLLPDCKARNKSLTEQPAPGNAETKYVSELSILPNPANTEINIAYRFTNDNAANSRSIQVYDAMGRPVTEIKLSNAAGLYNLNVSKYAQGIYFVEIRENNQHILIKRIIIHH